MSRARVSLPDAESTTEEDLKAPLVERDTHSQHRKRTSRNTRHESRQALRNGIHDDDVLEDVDAQCPKGIHDLGRHTSSAPRKDPKPGRRPGFKVWKSPYWKRRNSLRSEKNQAINRLIRDV